MKGRSQREKDIRKAFAAGENRFETLFPGDSIPLESFRCSFLALLVVVYQNDLLKWSIRKPFSIFKREM
jgi:hypothetical protein